MNNDVVTRRAFIQGASGIIAACALPIKSAVAASEEKLGTIICSEPEAAAKVGGAKAGYKMRNNLFFRYDMDSKVFKELEIPIGLSHDTQLHPIMKNQALVIEREGPYACLVDYKEMKVIRRIQASPEHNLTGHGTYTPDGQWLFLAQYPKNRLDLGNVLVLDTKDYKAVRTFETGGSAPHEFSWFPDGQRVAIGHYGLPSHYEPSNLRSMVAIYDVRKNRIIHELKSPSPNLYLCHVAVTQSERLFVLTHDSLSKRDPMAIKIKAIKQDYERYVEERPFYFDFSLHPSPILSTNDFQKAAPGNYQVNRVADNQRWGLSLAVNEDAGVVAGSHGFGGLVTFQKVSSGELIHEIRFPEGENPRAIIVTLSKKYFAITTDKGNLHYVDAKSFEIVRTENPRENRFNFVVHARCVDMHS